jgi:AraC-like DNA-binding protein
MSHVIRRYPVRNPLLKRYIRFFWEIRADHMQLNHRLIPQRYINLRLNLGETPQQVCQGGTEHRLEEVFFSGLFDRFPDAQLTMSGRVHVLGICFYPDGFYPFFRIPVGEFRNRLVSAGEIGFRVGTIIERLKEAPDVSVRLDILEHELALMLDFGNRTPESFRKVFHALKRTGDPGTLAEFCKRSGVGPRTLERQYAHYVGLSPAAFGTLSRFQDGLNQVLAGDYEKLSDVAYGQGYFDQMHFIRDFRRYAGNTPKNFVRQNNSILQIGKLA